LQSIIFSARVKILTDFPATNHTRSVITNTYYEET